MYHDNSVDLESLKGLQINAVNGMGEGSESVVFTLSNGKQFTMYHEQDCCESVYLADVCGDIDDLINATIVHFEERTEGQESDWDSTTYTFYDIQTTKGSVNLRWIGTSNGYYSESVDIKWSSNSEL
jgi:hypothetical protein